MPKELSERMKQEAEAYAVEAAKASAQGFADGFAKASGRPVPQLIVDLWAVAYKHAMIEAYLHGAGKACDLIVAGAGKEPRLTKGT
jgi:hypothetical protein